VTEERTRHTLCLPGPLWNELVLHLEAVALRDEETMTAMLNRWIEAGLRREQQELESDSEENK
jgi:hypothetical protein